MQISRSFLVACAAVCTTTLALGANDSPEQVKAREAMRQKMLESQPSPSAPPVSAADSEAAAKAREAVRQAPPPAAPPHAPAAVVNSDAPVPPPAPAAQQQADSQSIAKAREAVRQKINEPQVAAPAAAPAPPAAAAPPPPVVIVPPPAPAAAPPSAAMATPSAAEAADSAAIAKAREAMRQQMGQDTYGGPPADPQAIAKARESVRQRMQYMYNDPTSQLGNSAAMSFPPLEGPPLPISSQKHEQLDELLRRYKADQVTPEQYQAERAKILAGP